MMQLEAFYDALRCPIKLLSAVNGGKDSLYRQNGSLSSTCLLESQDPLVRGHAEEKIAFQVGGFVPEEFRPLFTWTSRIPTTEVRRPFVGTKSSDKARTDLPEMTFGILNKDMNLPLIPDA